MVVSAVAVGVEKTRAADGVELIFLDGDGDECRGPLAACWGHRFEDVPPVREFGWHRGQAHWPGLWWSATTGRHVGYESWLERDEVMALDFDREVVAFSSQPFWLCWPAGGRRRRHAPDFFARLADGTGLVIDVRAAERIEPRDAEAFELTRRACRSVGWRYRRVGGLGAVVAANLRWLSGYRHNQREISARRGLIVSGDWTTGKPPRSNSSAAPTSCASGPATPAAIGSRWST
jgi:hypothetical protein